jgi:hypothetical protein
MWPARSARHTAGCRSSSARARPCEARREPARQSSEGATELSQLLVELVNEQARRNLEALTALGQAVDWGRVFQVQSEFMHASFTGMYRLNWRYLEIVQDVMRATASTAGDQAKKAA